ncbi:cell wall-binding repeat-containing protein [Corynebacterium sp. YIM 101645]|uniref:Cell wall-binding repeat-containing protein n=1 Tax=Corynebacterium lemuris TaxID=1859292 RepID=A0ABT2FYL6_9CORY|nr:cell wall-binding repeat-containing protein [Corynebacterium lemuris]MCS5479870.1 cell wall-binding repeat-containing protein [Corynebacterium lemuris]
MRRLAAALAMTTTMAMAAGCTTATEGNSTADHSPRLPLDSSEVVADADTADRIFDTADVVVLAGPAPAEQRRAVEIAVATGAPLLADAAGLDRLEPTRVIAVGETGPIPEGPEVIAAPAGENAEPVTVAEIAALDPAQLQGVEGVDTVEPEYVMPPVLVSPETSVAAAATARAAGAELTVLDHPDPRLTSESMALVTEQDVLALGEQFGSQERFDRAVDLAANGELPGGGGLVFPGRRMIAFYGHPWGGDLGVMGEQPPAEAVARVQDHIQHYQALEEQPVVPAFEIIVTVASASPGADGKYTNVGDPAEFTGYIDAITEAGGYAFLDLQPGQASFLEQAKVYEELLKRPNVGLALDPEWNLQPGEQPLQRVGHAEAAEINEVADWLAQLVRENNLPQKGLIVHQFQMQMLRDREQINTDHPELAFILHADGHGVPDEKFATWDAVRQGLDDNWFMAWKNFIDEDNPTFTPEQTYDIEPRPWFISYQ